MLFQHVAHRSNRRANIVNFKGQPKIVQAIARGDVALVKQEILNGEDQNGSDADRRTYLHLASYFGRVDVVKCLLSVDARVNAKDSKWLTPLHYACRKNHDHVAATLIDHEADVECRDKQWVTPLHVCAANNSLECAKLFADRLPNMNVSDRSGATALHHAAFNGNCDMITFLLKKGCEPNAFDKKSRRPLHYAAAIDNSDSIRLLLAVGAAVNAHDHGLRTPLHFAAATGSLNAVQTLLDNGADLSAVDEEGNNALHWASLHGQDDVIEELLNRDISLINSANRDGMTALHFAAASDKGLAAIEHLVRYPLHVIDLNARDKSKRTPMHLAARFARLSCLQELLRHDADPTASDACMRTPLHYAIPSGNTRLLDALLEHPLVDANTVDSSGMTSLHHAAFHGLSHVVRHLLEHESKPSSPLVNDITGRPPHFLAALSGDAESLRILVSAYASQAVVSVLDNFNRSPLHYAAAAGPAGHECLEYLLNYDDGIASEERLDEEALAVLPPKGSVCAFSVNQRDIFGRSPLIYACEFDSDGDSVELLISNGASVDAKDSNDIYTLNYAAAAGRVSAVQVLLQTFYWNDVAFRVCPSHCAAFYGHPECLELLLKEGIYQNLPLTVEYSRRSSSGCFEVLENYIMTASARDESLAELTQYFTASDQSFHMQFLSNDTFTDLSQLDPPLARLSLEQEEPGGPVSQAEAGDADADPAGDILGRPRSPEPSASGETSETQGDKKSEESATRVNGCCLTAAFAGSDASPVNGHRVTSVNNNKQPAAAVAPSSSSSSSSLAEGAKARHASKGAATILAESKETPSVQFNAAVPS